MVFLGMDLSRSATSALSESVVATLPYALLILLVGVSSWFSSARFVAATQTQRSTRRCK